MMISTLLVLAAVQNAATSGCPSGAQALKELGVSGPGWVTACRLTSDGRRLLAGVRAPDASATDVRVAAAILVPSSPSLRLEFGLQGSESAEIQAHAKLAEEWQVVIESKAWGAESLLRVGVWGSAGEDLFIGQEIVTFLRVEGGTLVPVWTGLGDRIERQFDSCLLESTAKFRRLPDGRLERVTSTRRTFRNAGIAKDLAADLHNKCVAAPRRKDAFTVEKVRAK